MMGQENGLPELPKGWAWTKLSEIGDVASGGTPSTKDGENFDGEVPWLTPADLSNFKYKFVSRGRRNISEKGLRCSSAVMLPAGSILFSSRAPIGYVAITSNPISTNQGFKNLTLYEGIFNEYVFYYLKANKRLAEGLASGTTFLEISGSRFASIPIPLPPGAEQHRIVAKIEELFTKLDAGVEALKKVKAQLKRYRQAVLKYAFEGKLTEEWRKAHKNNIEPASALLDVVTKPGKALKGKHGELHSVETSDLPGLPQGWEWVNLAICSNLITKGESPKWQGFNYVDDGIPFIRSENVLWGRVDLSTVARISREFHEKLKRSQIRAGDVLINLVGASIGRCGIVPPTVSNANINQAVAVIRVNGALESHYLMHLLLSPDMQRKIHAGKVETARPNISLTDLNNLTVPLPPPLEQQQIVNEIERRLSAVSEAESVIGQGLRRAERLRQSILKKALEGKLVAQDPNDEPASVLLDQIRSEKAKHRAAEELKKSGKRNSVRNKGG